MNFFDGLTAGLYPAFCPIIAVIDGWMDFWIDAETVKVTVREPSHKKSS